jgi:hypothetical protein
MKWAIIMASDSMIHTLIFIAINNMLHLSISTSVSK